MTVFGAISALHRGLTVLRGQGEPACPPLALFEAMLLSIWYDGDVTLSAYTRVETCGR